MVNIYKPKVAILREVGSNGHREMIAAFTHAGFEVLQFTLGTHRLLNEVLKDG